jgi:hypothetical protein
LSTINLNAYYTIWQDKSLLSRENIQLENSSDTRALIRGLDATHMGIELEISTQVLQHLNVEVSSSIGDWRWKNDVNALLYNDNGELIDSTSVFVKNIRVGDAPQFTIGISGELHLLKDWLISSNLMYYGNLYANFDPAGRNNPNDRSQPFRLPNYSMADIHIEYSFLIGLLKSNISMSCYNIMNNESILRGEDGPSHNLDSFQGFWSPGRTFNFSLKIMF